MSKNMFVFEIGVEEIPSQYVKTMANSLLDNAEKMLSDLRLEYSNAKVFYTPRRLVLMIDELSDEQASLNVTVKGPATKIAFDSVGNPSNALNGFLRKNNKGIDDVYTVTDSKNEYVAVDVTYKGDKTINVLRDSLSKLVSQIYNPNPMHWGSYSIKFIRPIRWLLALYGNHIIEAEIECTVSNNVSYGHRTLANRAIVIASAEAYMNEMLEAYVIVDQDKRKQVIVSQIHELEAANGFVAEVDEKLLDEVTNIVEYPTCTVGQFDEKYLLLPECIIKDPLKNQQRYFPVYIEGKITNKFIYTRNGGDYFIDNVTRGNERVLRPRLEDAEFFYAADLKSSMEEKASLLENVVYIENGGSYADKSRRIAEIALRLASRVGYPEVDLIKQTARIMKADLVSAVVREYTDTQGLVGGVFAANEGYDSHVCTAISEQYLPNFYGDNLPSEQLSSIMSIADKLDTVMCLCAVGLKPAGSSDPYGLRRQTLGIFNVALEIGFNLDFDTFIRDCTDLYSDNLVEQNETIDEYVGFVQNYFYQRLRVFLHDEKGFSYDDLDKISVSDLNVCKSVKKASMISEIRDAQWYLDFVQIFNRIVKLVKSSNDAAGTFDCSVADVAAENMFNAFYTKKDELLDFIRCEKYESAIQTIAEIGKSINAFMENNLALCDDETMRMNRLAFFHDFCEVCGTIIQI